MKNLLLLGLLLCLASTAHAQQDGLFYQGATKAPAPTPTPFFLTADDAKQAAIEKYPDLAVKGSRFNSDFLGLYTRYQQDRPEYFSSSDWPLRLAKEVAYSEGMAEMEALRRGLPDKSDLKNNELVSGHVISRVPQGGVLIQYRGNDILLRGLPSEDGLADGDFVNTTKAVRDGLFQYTNAQGVAVTVHAYKAIATSN